MEQKAKEETRSSPGGERSTATKLVVIGIVCLLLAIIIMVLTKLIVVESLFRLDEL